MLFLALWQCTEKARLIKIGNKTAADLSLEHLVSVARKHGNGEEQLCDRDWHLLNSLLLTYVEEVFESGQVIDFDGVVLGKSHEGRVFADFSQAVVGRRRVLILLGDSHS